MRVGHGHGIRSVGPGCLWVSGVGDSGVVDHCLCRNPSGSGEGASEGVVSRCGCSASQHLRMGWLEGPLCLDPLSGRKRWGFSFFTVKKVRLREAGLLTRGHTARIRLHKELSALFPLWWGGVPRQIHPPNEH